MIDKIVLQRFYEEVFVNTAVINLGKDLPEAITTVKEMVEYAGYSIRYRHYRTGKYFGHKDITIAILILPSRVYYGIAECHPNDSFNKAKGRTLAEERLLNLSHFTKHDALPIILDAYPNKPFIKKCTMQLITNILTLEDLTEEILFQYVTILNLKGD